MVSSMNPTAIRPAKLFIVGALLLLVTLLSPTEAGGGHWKKGMHKGMRGMHGKGKGMHKGRRRPPVTVQLLQRPFGVFEGKRATLYTLRVGRVSVDITDFGATLVSVRVPAKGRRGTLADVTAGFSHLANYSSTNYGNLGCVIGRYGGRIGGHSFVIRGKRYELDANLGNNTLHGGSGPFCFGLWKARTTVRKRAISLTLSLTSPDGSGGFPGLLSVVAKYTLTDTASLVLDMSATTDKPTHINLVHHPYWNLNGARPTANLTATAAKHRLQIYAAQYTPLGIGSIPTGEIKPVSGTRYNFVQPKVLGSVVSPGNGYDNNFVLSLPRNKAQKLWPAVMLRDPASGRTMRIYTNQPGVQFYSANYLNVVGKGGVKYSPQSFFAFETQHFPDSPNKPNFPSTLLSPGQIYQHTIVYEFSAY